MNAKLRPNADYILHAFVGRVDAYTGIKHVFGIVATQRRTRHHPVEKHIYRSTPPCGELITAHNNLRAGWRRYCSFNCVALHVTKNSALPGQTKIVRLVSSGDSVAKPALETCNCSLLRSISEGLGVCSLNHHSTR